MFKVLKCFLHYHFAQMFKMTPPPPPHTHTHTHSLTVSAVCSILTSTLAVYWSLEVADLCCLNFDSEREKERSREGLYSKNIKSLLPLCTCLVQKGLAEILSYFLQAFSSVPVGYGKDRCCSQFPLTHRKREVKRERWLERMRMIEINYETVRNKTEIWYKSSNLWYFSARMGWRDEMSFTFTAWPKL